MLTDGRGNGYRRKIVISGRISAERLQAPWQRSVSDTDYERVAMQPGTGTGRGFTRSSETSRSDLFACGRHDRTRPYV